MSVTERGVVSFIQLTFRRAVQFLMLLVLTASGAILCAQTVTIKLVNGRNGHPMSNSHVNVWVGTTRKMAIVIPTDIYGIAQLRLTNNDDVVDLHNRLKSTGSNVMVDPILKYDDSLRVNVGYVLCQPHTPDYSWLAIASFSTRQLIEQGIVMPNTCGEATASPQPGELVVFVRPLSWLEKMKQ